MDDLGTEAFPWVDAVALVKYAQPDSALFKALNPHWQQSPELELLRAVEHDLRVLSWLQSDDARRRRNFPERIPFPWDPEPEGVIKGDVMTIDEAADWLGWQVPA